MFGLQILLGQYELAKNEKYRKLMKFFTDILKTYERHNIMKNTIIKTSETKQLFKEYYKENKLEFSQKKFEAFLKFLEIDFYDWVKQNLKHYET